MRTFLLEQTEDAPLVHLDPDKGHMIFSGRSFMEDASIYLDATIDWLRNYMSNPQPHNVIEFELEYVNSASHCMLIRIMEEVNKYYIMGYDFQIIWKYHHEDESIEYLGRELEEMFDVPISYHVLV